ncbi:MAG TPA: DUF488 domain-containing protein [Acidimicrobiales bacterium]|nr:DUF488 domain-containing protein [Acidimicrobiales bacterium]
MAGAPALWTVGHGTLSADAFAALVRGAGLTAVADVRRYPGSRRYPHFGADMARWLPEAGVAYAWLPALGGRRRAAPDSPNIGLRNLRFRAYADHMATPEFAAGVADLLALATDGDARVAVMCAESLWWRCHRRLLADHLALVVGAAVTHLAHDGRTSPHPPTREARPAGGHLVYDLGTQPSLPV